MAPVWTVVKVGGSLFDWPDLRARLGAWLDMLDAERVLLVPGGGRAADAVRGLDLTHQLGDEVSHWLAIHVLSVNAQFLHSLLPGSRIVAQIEPDSAAELGPARVNVLDPLPFFRADEMNADRLPHHWDVTSDSLAVRAAILVAARTLVLLKSVAWEGTGWREAARAGIVDEYFSHALSQASADLCVRIVNLRTA